MNADEGFAVRKFESADTQDFLRGILKTRNVVPFLGAGFTAGERARGGIVPGGAAFQSMMKEGIRNSNANDKPGDADLDRLTFQELAHEYFAEDIVPLAQIKQTISDAFTNVRIADAAKKSFLRAGWPYLYTLNIDDGIERFLDAVKVLPYTDFSRIESRQFVYKLHGDAEATLSAASREDLKLVFGKADYIKSLIRNRALISTLSNDLLDKNILFVGCSLKDEIDIAFALAGVSPSEKPRRAARVYFTSNYSDDWDTRRKLKFYGITDVVVGDYSLFYSFVESVAKDIEQHAKLLAPYKFDQLSKLSSQNDVLRYVLQIGWKHTDNPYDVSVPRDPIARIRSMLREPIAVFWGRRFSGKTTALFRLLEEERGRQRFFLGARVSGNDSVLNEVLKVRDAVVAIDSEVFHHEQIKRIVRNADRLRDNRTTVIFAVTRNALGAFGSGIDEAAIELPGALDYHETKRLNLLLDPLGLAEWKAGDKNLDNIFRIGRSPIVDKQTIGISKLFEKIEREKKEWSKSPSNKLSFAILFYLGIRQRMFSRQVRELTRALGASYVVDDMIDTFGAKWSPFVEIDDADFGSLSTERSSRLLVSNAGAWIQFAIRELSAQMGPDDTADVIVDLYKALDTVETNAFELLMFDSLNAIYDSSHIASKDWGSKIIRLVYERLAAVLAQDPNYWLQRAKGIYYMSNSEDDLRIAVAYCEKSIVKLDKNVSLNVKLTKANLLGKICSVAKPAQDEDLSSAITGYIEAIASRNENPRYIDELLRKSSQGKGYMNFVCKAAMGRLKLINRQPAIEEILSYVSGR